MKENLSDPPPVVKWLAFLLPLSFAILLFLSNDTRNVSLILFVIALLMFPNKKGYFVINKALYWLSKLIESITTVINFIFESFSKIIYIAFIVGIIFAIIYVFMYIFSKPFGLRKYEGMTAKEWANEADYWNESW